MSDINPVSKVRAKFIHSEEWIGQSTDTFLPHHNEYGTIYGISAESFNGDFILQGSLDGVNWSDVESLLFGDYVRIQTLALYWRISPVSVGPIHAKIIVDYRPHTGRRRNIPLIKVVKFASFGLYVDATYVDANYILGE